MWNSIESHVPKMHIVSHRFGLHIFSAYGVWSVFHEEFSWNIYLCSLVVTWHVSTQLIFIFIDSRQTLKTV